MPLTVGALAGLIVAWALVGFFVDPLGFVTLVPPKFRGGEEVAEALIRFFGALILIMFLADDEMGRRMRWVAGGFFVLGMGYLLFGYVEPLLLDNGGISPRERLNAELYEEMLMQTAAAILFVVALVAKSPPRLAGRIVIGILVLIGVTYVVLFKFPGEIPLPPLVNLDSLEQMVQFGVAPSGWFTSWHWALAALPLALAVVAVAGAVRQSRRGTLRGWLLIAMVLWAGSLLHEYVYPWAHDSDVLTSADVLHLAVAAVVAVGGVSELRRVAAERAALLATEQENYRRLAILRADFGDMVAHELGSPLSAIRRLIEMLEIEDLGPRARASALAIVESEINTLDTLVKDVHAAAAIERDDFKVISRPVPLVALLANAEAFAGTLPGDHRLDVVLDDALGGAQERVLADPERIGQVLHNLLSNAAKYSPEGTPIELRASRGRRRVSIEVADRGPGIHPDDLTLIFEKFGRARDLEGRRVPGVGLGLYLSRRIVQSHGSDLTVRSELGEGSVFGFELEVAR